MKQQNNFEEIEEKQLNSPLLPNEIILDTHISDEDIKNTPNNPLLTYSHAFKEIFTRAAPYTGSQFILMGGDFITVVMLASLSSDALAASNLISSLQNWFVSTAGATLSATSILAGRKIGTKDSKQIAEVGNILHQSWIFACIMSIPGIVIALTSKPLLISLSQPPEVTDLVENYFYGYTIALPARFMLGANRRAILATSHPSTGFIMDILYKSVNVGLAYCMIFGKLGFPKMEVLGLGIANSTTTIAAFIGSTLYLMFNSRFKPYHFTKLDLSNTRSRLLELGRLGVPIGVKVGVELGALFATSVMIGALDKDQLAAHEASFQYVFIIATPTYSIMEAVSTFVSKAIGAGEIQYAKKLGNAGAFLGALVAALPLILFTTIPNQMLSAFMNVDDPDNSSIVNTARTLLIINGIGQIPDALRNIFSGGLSGFYDSVTPTVVIIATVLVIHLPLTYVMAYPLNLEAPGAMIARDISMAVGAGIIGWQWFKKQYIPSSLPTLLNPINDSKVIDQQDSKKSIHPRLSNCCSILLGSKKRSNKLDEEKTCFQRIRCNIL